MLKKGFKQFLNFYSRLSHSASITASICIFLMICTIVPDSIGRFFFNRPLHGTLELNMLLMSAIVFLSLSWTQSQRGHVRVEMFLSRLNPKMRSIVNILCWFMAFGLFFAITVAGAEEAAYSTQIRENLWGVKKFPVWPGKIIAVFGAALLCIQLLIDIGNEIKNLVTGQDGRGHGNK